MTRKHRIPGGLAVVMGMDVDPARCHQQAVCVDFSLAGTSLAADLGDGVAIQREVAGISGFPGPIDDRTASDHRIMHGSLPNSFFVTIWETPRRRRSSFPPASLAGNTRRKYEACAHHA